jgi:hypothetical protein
MSILIASFVYKYLQKKNIISPEFKPQEKVQVAFGNLRTSFMNLFL